MELTFVNCAVQIRKVSLSFWGGGRDLVLLAMWCRRCPKIVVRRCFSSALCGRPDRRKSALVCHTLSSVVQGDLKETITDTVGNFPPNARQVVQVRGRGETDREISEEAASRMALVVNGDEGGTDGLASKAG